MSVNIVTGFTGQAHITSDDDRIRNAAYIGTDKFVMPFGNQFEAEVQNNNLIRIKDGMLMNQGTQMGIELTDYEDVVIENGLSGTNRNDLIVMRYEKQEDTGLESASLVVIKGTSGATASDPTYISGNILDGGDLIDDYPLYRVKVESLSIVAVQQLFSTRADVGSELNRIEDKMDQIDNNYKNKMDKTNPTGTGSFSMNRKADTTVGNYSVAEGNNTTASGRTSHAEGYNTTASGSYAHAEGETTTASGRASHAEGYNTTASGAFSHAGGFFTTSQYENQTVIGKHNDNKETNLFEVGNGTSSSNRSNALEVRQNGDIYAGGDFYDGDGNKLGGDKMDKTNPTGTGSFSMNRKENTTVGVLSATVNENNTASGDGSFASGHNNTASGLYSNASGTSTTASGSYSHTEGNNTTASGSRSHAEGDGTTASEMNAHAEGETTTASGRASHSEGMNTTASGTRSHAAGYYTVAGYSNQTVVGKHNDNKETNLFEVGNGISGNSKSNAFEVSESGNAIAGTDVLYNSHKRVTGSYASDILVECTDLQLGPDNTITGRDGDNVPIHTGTYDLKVGSIIYVPEDLHSGMNVPAGLYEVLYLVDGGNDISYLSFGDYQRDEPDPAHVKYMPKSLEERIEELTKKQVSDDILLADNAKKNYVIPPHEPGYTETTSGVTFTVNDDYSIVANGIATGGDATLDFMVTGLPLKNLILSGCPSGGSRSTYRLVRWDSSWGNVVEEYGNGQIFSNNDTKNIFRVVVSEGATAPDLIFQPMIRPVGTTPDYVPYMLSNLELTRELNEGGFVYNQNGKKSKHILDLLFDGDSTASSLTFDQIQGWINSYGIDSVNAHLVYQTSSPSVDIQLVACRWHHNNSIGFMGVSVDPTHSGSLSIAVYGVLKTVDNRVFIESKDL